MSWNPIEQITEDEHELDELDTQVSAKQANVFRLFVFSHVFKWIYGYSVLDMTEENSCFCPFQIISKHFLFIYIPLRILLLGAISCRRHLEWAQKSKRDENMSIFLHLSGTSSFRWPTISDIYLSVSIFPLIYPHYSTYIPTNLQIIKVTLQHSHVNV